MSEYNQLKGQVTAAARKQTGSLAVRDLTGLISEEDAVNTENLITLFTVVSKHDKGEWLSTYETLSDFVVRPLQAAMLKSTLISTYPSHPCCAYHLAHQALLACFGQQSWIKSYKVCCFNHSRRCMLGSQQCCSDIRVG